MHVGSSNLSDALIRSEEYILRLWAAQTRRTVNPERLPDPLSSVTVVVVVVAAATADRFSGTPTELYISFATERQVIGSP